MDFHGDLDMQLPAGEQWDDGGKTLDHIILHFIFYDVFGFLCICPNDEHYGMHM